MIKLTAKTGLESKTNGELIALCEGRGRWSVSILGKDYAFNSAKIYFELKNRGFEIFDFAPNAPLWLYKNF